MALTDSPIGEVPYGDPFGNPTMESQNNITQYATETDALEDFNGYNWTYSKDSTSDGRIKANFVNDYRPYYYAARYVPTGGAATGANVGKWYLPSLGEWAAAFKTLCKWDGTFVANGYYNTKLKDVDVRKMDKACIDAGGTKMKYDQYSGGSYWTSTEKMGSLFYYLYIANADNVLMQNNAKHNIGGPIRPFVHF